MEKFICYLQTNGKNNSLSIIIKAYYFVISFLKVISLAKYLMWVCFLLLMRYKGILEVWGFFQAKTFINLSLVCNCKISLGVGSVSSIALVVSHQSLHEGLIRVPQSEDLLDPS